MVRGNSAWYSENCLFLGAVRHLFVPAEKRIPRVRIETRQSDKLATQRILVALDSWPRNSRYPLGHFVRALGPIGKWKFVNFEIGLSK